MTVFIISLSVVAVLFALLLFLVAPAGRRHKDLSLMKGLHIAHRGLHDDGREAPENSLEAFRRAADSGFAIENDIHLTKDGRIVIFHDDDLFRMCGVNGRPEDKTLSELKELRLLDTDERIPTLEECLSVIDGKVPVLIEFKLKSGSADPLCRAADEILSGYKGKYFIQSFYPPVLLWYRKNRRDVCRGQLASAFKGDKLHMKLLGCLFFNFLARPDFLSYEFCHAKHSMRRLCVKLGAFPVGWTFKNQKDMTEYEKYFDTYIFEGFLPK